MKNTNNDEKLAKRVQPARFALCVFIPLMAISSWLFANIYGSIHNNLAENGRWDSSKLGIDIDEFMDLPGAWEQMGNKQALAGARLNLGTWQGFMEIVLKKPLHSHEVDFDFRLSVNSHLYFIFDKSSETYRAVRLSSGGPYGNAIVIIKNTGEFLQKKILEATPMQPDRWHRFRAVFQDKKCSVLIDGVQFAEFQWEEIPDSKIGFRGCDRDVKIDNVRILDQSGKVIFKETFEYAGSKWRQNFILAFSALSVLSVAMGLSLSFLKKNTRKVVFFKLFLFHLTGIGLLAAVLFIRTRTAGDYPPPYYWADSFGNKIHWSIPQYERIRRQISSRYKQNADPGVYRIMIIGSSQAAGLGASRPEERIGSVIESQLNARLKGRPRVECLRMCVPGYYSTYLLNNYKERWLSYHPNLTVIYLGHNDQGTTSPEAYKKAMREFVTLNKTLGIGTAFILEATDSFNQNMPERLATHHGMQSIAAEERVPVIDLHAYLRERFDDGILWWDEVHLTSFGQLIAGKYIADRLGIKPE